MKLYEIPFAHRQLLDAIYVDEDSGEIVGMPELTSFKEEAEEKIEATACYLKEQEADIKTLAEQIKHLQARKKSLELQRDRLKALLADAMLAVDVQKVKTPQISVSVRVADKAVYEEDEARLDGLRAAFPDFVKTKLEPNKTAIKDACKDGIPPELAELVHFEQEARLTIR